MNAGLLTEAQVDEALREGSQTGERLGEVVVRRGLASEEKVAQMLAEQWQLSFVDRASIWFDADALARLSREDAQRLQAMPTRVQDGRVVVAVAEPTEQRLGAVQEETLRAIPTGCEYVPGGAAPDSEEWRARSRAHRRPVDAVVVRMVPPSPTAKTS